MELETKQLVSAVRQIAEEKNLDEALVKEIIEQAIAAAYRKDFGEREQEVRCMINLVGGDVTIYASKLVVNDVQDETAEIALAAAKTIKKDAKIGDLIEVMEKPSSFGRVAAQTAKQVMLQRLREAEREVVMEEFQDKIGKVLVGTVQRVESRVVRIDLGKAAGIMPKSEQIAGEIYTAGSRIKVFLKDVEKSSRGPQLILSRGNNEFIIHLFRNEVPEMESGAVEIKTIAREPGTRTKIAVASTVPGVDPVGTFVGGHGTRVQAVMSEIGDQEKIDIIPYSENNEEFIKKSLSGTEIQKVVINEKAKTAKVIVDEGQLSIGIGRGGQNVRLASKLTGYDIDISSDVSDEKSASKKEDLPAKKIKRKEELEESLISAIDQVGTDIKKDIKKD